MATISIATNKTNTNNKTLGDYAKYGYYPLVPSYKDVTGRTIEAPIAADYSTATDYYAATASYNQAAAATEQVKTTNDSTQSALVINASEGSNPVTKSNTTNTTESSKNVVEPNQKDYSNMSDYYGATRDYNANATQMQYQNTLNKANVDYLKGSSTYGKNANAFRNYGLTGSGYTGMIDTQNAQNYNAANYNAQALKYMQEAENQRVYDENMYNLAQANEERVASLRASIEAGVYNDPKSTIEAAAKYYGWNDSQKEFLYQAVETYEANKEEGDSGNNAESDSKKRIVIPDDAYDYDATNFTMKLKTDKNIFQVKSIGISKDTTSLDDFGKYSGSGNNGEQDDHVLAILESARHGSVNNGDVFDFNYGIGKALYMYWNGYFYKVVNVEGWRGGR